MSFTIAVVHYSYYDFITQANKSTFIYSNLRSTGYVSGSEIQYKAESFQILSSPNNSSTWLTHMSHYIHLNNHCTLRICSAHHSSSEINKFVAFKKKTKKHLRVTNPSPVFDINQRSSLITFFFGSVHTQTEPVPCLIIKLKTAALLVVEILFENPNSA